MEFPTLVYRIPGPHIGPGCTYAWKGVNDAAGFGDAIGNGWFPTIADAKGGLVASAAVDAAEALEDAIDDVSPSARNELEQTAKSLGVSFNKRTTDAVLIKRITEAS